MLRFEPLDGSGAAETCEPRQVREEAAVRRPFRVPSGSLPGGSFLLMMKPARIILLSGVFVIVGIAMVVLSARKNVTVAIEGREQTYTTFAYTVADLLREAGLAFTAEDQIWPDPAQRLEDGARIRVNRADLVHIWADGDSQTLVTTERQPANLLAQVGVMLFPGDGLRLNGQPVHLNQTIPEGTLNNLQIVRAVPIRIKDGPDWRQIYSSQATLGQALWEAGISVFESDNVIPGLQTPLTAPLEVVLDRSQELSIQVEGKTHRLRSAAQTVGGALAEVGLALQGLDYSLPAEAETLPKDGRIRIVRVLEELIVEQEPLAFETTFQPDPEFEIDQQRILEPGEFGLTATRVRVRYEDGEEVSRRTDDSWVAVEPKPRVMGYGTKIVVRTLNTADGPIEYWRAINAYATSYSPCRIFQDRCSYQTASGATLQHGIAAVTLYWYRTMGGGQVYVDGYGVASILDTGGGIPGRNWIDLGYSDDDFRSWHQWVTVYLLTPVPSPDRILYILN